MVQKPEKTLTAKAVGREFVRQYYTMLAKEPKYLHRFYGSNSEMMHGNKDDQTPAIGQVKIRENIKALAFKDKLSVTLDILRKDCYTKIAQLDAFLTIGDGIVVQVAGEVSNNGQQLRRFMQTFVLGPQQRDGVDPGTSFYVHNDIFRYQDDIFDDPAAPESGNGDYENLSRKMENLNGNGSVQPTQYHQPQEGSNNQPQDNGDAQNNVPFQQTQQAQMVQQMPAQTIPAPMAQQIPLTSQMAYQIPVANQMPAPIQTTPSQPTQILPQQIPVAHQSPVQIQSPQAANQMASSQQEPETQPPPPQPHFEEVQNKTQENSQQHVSEVQSTEEVVEESKVVEPVAEEVVKVVEPAVPSAPAAPLSWAARMKMNQNAAASGALPGAPAVQPTPIPPKPEPVKATPASAPVVEEEAVRETAPTRSQNREYQKSFSRDRDGGERRDGESGGFRERRFRDGDDRNQIFVGGLPPNMSEENIRGVFAKFGTIRHVRMNQNTNSRPGAGFGFVTFSSPQEAEAALSERDSIYFNNLQLNIEEKKMKPVGGQGAGGQRGPPREGGRGGKFSDSRGSRGMSGQYQSRENRGSQGGRPQGSGRESYGNRDRTRQPR